MKASIFGAAYGGRITSAYLNEVLSCMDADESKLVPLSLGLVAMRAAR